MPNLLNPYRFAAPWSAPNPSAGDHSSGADSLVLPTVNAGDYLFVGTSIGTDPTATGDGVSGISGLVEFATSPMQSPGNGNRNIIHAYRKVLCDGSESGQTLTVNGSGSGISTIAALVVRPSAGGQLADDVSAQIAQDVNRTSATLPSVTTTAANDVVIYWAGANQFGVITLTMAAGPTQIETPSDNGGTQRGVLAHLTKATAGATATVGLTASALSGLGGWVVAVKEIAA